ncbi:transposase [Microtetraspora sp. NBRC 16547]|uniref:transposase n=1 Tax=Microtetraspora sp. NBRC 16547 TaxID=3030993 RepID=UPI0024A1F495|nr:transposase [Microtetraspora sp. NBRC 16547]GLW96174.1 hypothetical protein Misp02_02610 [Microtetraspora sp. NBRC 16547]
MTDLSGYAKKSTANGDTRSGLRLRLRIAVPGWAADADPPQHLTCGKFNSHFWSPSPFAASCGDGPLSIIKEYIENQKRPD